MSGREGLSEVLYFGKLPSRGDFVRSSGPPGVISAMDRWLSAALEALASEPRWKLLYDNAPSLPFAVLGTHNARGLVGHLRSSRDAAGRRFPFVAAARVAVTQPLLFLQRSPLVLAEPWARLGWAVQRVCEASEADDAAPVLDALGRVEVQVDPAAAVQQLAFRDFLDACTLAQMEAWLSPLDGSSLRHIVLALGLLMQPLLSGRVERLERGLALPLPREPVRQPMVASLWLELMAGFLKRRERELLVCMPQAPGRPQLVVGFDGSSPRTLRALMDEDYAAELFIDVQQADWVEDHLGQDFGLRKLSSYLAQQALSLRQAVDTFNEVFLGL